MEKLKITILSGAGMSADSGLKTFRDSNGLWEEHSIYEVATPEAFARQPELVHRFYNLRRAQLKEAMPNPGHIALQLLEDVADVDIITQNVDNLHERGGSTSVIHLHGELTKVRSSLDENYIEDWGYEELNANTPCPGGGYWRPHIVWFGEEVPLLQKAAEIVSQCDELWVIGTSLQVYPAAGLLDLVPRNASIHLFDVEEPSHRWTSKVVFHKGKAGQVIPEYIHKRFNIRSN